jgi:hypothetical protein
MLGTDLHCGNLNGAYLANPRSLAANLYPTQHQFVAALARNAAATALEHPYPGSILPDYPCTVFRGHWAGQFLCSNPFHND